MAGFLLALILIGSTLHTAVSEGKEQKASEVKYEGPVVYTNLPPPVLYFPNFPEKDKISNRGSSGDTEDKPIEYVPFPYKDLPLLVYKSDKQPPVHVVEKRQANEDAGSANPSKPLTGQGYQTGPAVYRATGQFGKEPAAQHSIPTISGPNAGLTTPPMPAANVQNQQYISIGVSSIKQQEQLQAQNIPQHQASYYNSGQYDGSQNSNQGQYESDGSQSGPSFSFYANQQYSQQGQLQQPSFQIPQGIQNYMLQQNQEQQHAQSMNQNLAYGDSQMEGMNSESAALQHVGITIIRPGDASDDNSQGGQQYQQPVQMLPPKSQVGDEMGYGGNQQFVSIGVFPIPETSDDYGQDEQPYYTEMVQPPMNQYQSADEGYQQPASSPAMVQGPENPGYQFISIDLSSLRNQQANQQNAYSDQSQQIYPMPQPPAEPPQEMYSSQNQNGQSYGNGEKGIQQIVIQIPQNVVSERPEKLSQQNKMPERPYRGTAQVSTMVKQPKSPPSLPQYRRPIYNRPPPPQRPPPAFGFPPAGINIAIIKQSDSTNIPQFRPPERIPYASQSSKVPMYQNHHPENYFPPPAHHSLHRPPMRPHPRPAPFNSQRFNRGHDMPASASTYHSSNIRHPPPPSFRQHRSRPPPPPQGPELQQSSNVYYSSRHPATMKPPPFKEPFVKHPHVPFGQISASMSHPRIVPMAGNMPFNPDFAESALQAFTNNITDDLDDASFDYINAFLDPSYDFYGLAPNVQDQKKEEENIIQKLTAEMMMQDLKVATNHLAAGMQPMIGVVPPFGMARPHPGVPNAPFPYRYWEQPVRGVVPQNIGGGFMSQYSHFQHPYVQNQRPFGRFGKGRRKPVFGKGVRGLRGKLASFRSSIRQKKIAPRQETAEEGTETEMQKIDKESATMNAAPRSTIIQTEGQGLDGIPIPLNPDVLSSRISTEEDEKEKPNRMPPIIVYEGTKPPYEIYGTKEDIEGSGKNETSKESTKASEMTDLASDESSVSYSADSSGYFNYMYSMLPDLIRDTLGRRQDGVVAKWAPVVPLEYALAEDAYDRNDTGSPQVISPIELETIPIPQNSSVSGKTSIEELLAETFALLASEEKSDIL